MQAYHTLKEIASPTPVRLGAVLNSVITIHCYSMIVKEHLIRGRHFSGKTIEKNFGEKINVSPSKNSDLTPDGRFRHL